MSDSRLRELEVAWKTNPTEETVRAYVLARRRAGEEGVRGLRFVEFRSRGARKGGGRYSYRKSRGAQRAWFEDSTSGEQIAMCLMHLNPAFDHLRGRWLVGCFEPGPHGSLKWVSP